MSSRFNNLDLNLLRTFDVLMEEKSVSLAAKRLHLTQSSASNALDRLRQSLGDQILEREGRKMVPTRKAIELWPGIRDALRGIANTIGELDDFEPFRLHQEFRIGIDEYTLGLLGAGILSKVTVSAPVVRLAFLSTNPQEYERSLTAGEVDLVIGPVWWTLKGLESEPLFSETFLCLVRRNHPILQRHLTTEVTIADYVGSPHLLVSSRGFVSGNVDAGLTMMGYKREVAVTTPYISSVPLLLRASDMIVNMGARFALNLAEQEKLVAFPLPLAVPGFRISIIWHPRNSASKSAQWLRKIVCELAGRL